MPRQELWIHENRSNLCANVILPAGAAMDYVAQERFVRLLGGRAAWVWNGLSGF